MGFALVRIPTAGGDSSMPWTVCRHTHRSVCVCVFFSQFNFLWFPVTTLLRTFQRVSVKKGSFQHVSLAMKAIDRIDSSIC